MKINRNNYEIYFIDYFDGVLNQNDENLLFEFLSENPDLYDEFKCFENTAYNINKINDSYSFKETLKRDDNAAIFLINNDNFHEFLIADIEGDLNKVQKKQLEVFLLQNKDKNNEYILFKNTKLKPDLSIKYPDKSKIKKFSIITNNIKNKSILQIVSIAASIVLIFSVYTFWKNKINNDINRNILTELNIKNPIKSNNNFKVLNNYNYSKSDIKNKIVENINKNKLSENKIKNNIKVNNISKLNTNTIEFLSNNINIINREKREYFTYINEILIKTETSNLIVEDNNPSIIKNNYISFNDNFLREQPVIETGNILKNAAIIGLSKIEEISYNLKSKYQEVEKMFAKK